MSAGALIQIITVVGSHYGKFETLCIYLCNELHGVRDNQYFTISLNIPSKGIEKDNVKQFI